VFNCEGIRHTAIVKDKVKRVAVCSGSGSFLLSEAILQGADVFVSGDFTYHKFFDADRRIVIADLGHFETEIGIKNVFVDILQKKFYNFVVLKSDINTNPIKYL
jgi:putative NIF3 family GTP cyclohydrolase 1 type 2